MIPWGGSPLWQCIPIQYWTFSSTKKVKVNGHLDLLLAIYYNSEMAENCTTHPLHLLCCFIIYLGYFAFIVLLLCIMLSDFSKIEFSTHILSYFTILMIFCITGIILKYIKYETAILNCKNFSQYYCFLSK